MIRRSHLSQGARVAGVRCRERFARQERPRRRQSANVALPLSDNAPTRTARNGIPQRDRQGGLCAAPLLLLQSPDASPLPQRAATGSTASTRSQTRRNSESR